MRTRGALRGLVTAGFAAAMLALTPPVAQAEAAHATVVASAPAAVVAPAPAASVTPGPPAGPVIDPAANQQANARNSRNRIIAGVVAVVLAVIVFFGRRSHNRKRKQSG